MKAGVPASARLYTMGMYSFAALSTYFALTWSDPYIARMAAITGVLVVPQMYLASKELSRLANNQKLKSDSPDIRVSILEIQVCLLWIAMLWWKEGTTLI